MSDSEWISVDKWQVKDLEAAWIYTGTNPAPHVGLCVYEAAIDEWTYFDGFGHAVGVTHVMGIEQPLPPPPGEVGS